MVSNSGLFRWLFVALTALLVSCRSADRDEGNFSQLYDSGDRRAFEVGSDPSALRQQLARTQSMIDEREAALARAVDKDDAEDIEEHLELLRYVRDWVAATLRKSPGPSSKDALSVNVQVERILDAAELAIREEEGRKDKFAKVAINFLSTMILGHSLPALSAEQQGRSIGDRQAGRESAFLYDPHSREFYGTSQLAALSAEQVSQLDVSPQHPGWYRAEEYAGMRRNRLENFESWIESGMTAALRADGDLPAGRQWDIDGVRKVLFMEEIYKSATSAKGKVEDAYGGEWKIKWGDEVQAEAVSGRIYLLAGAKMTDLVFAGGGGPEEMVLILNEQGEYEAEEAEEGAEREPETVEQMIATLKDFYGFDLQHYIHSHGEITADNVSSVLRNLPRGGKKKYRPGELIGRHWVSFREYSVELRPDGFVRREDGSRMSDLAANSDRVARGLYLFSLWLSNRDVKDDNNKAFFIRNPSAGGDIVEYREGHHDMGVTIGAMGSSAEINAMATGEQFISEKLLGRGLRSRQAFIYRPEAWKNATWSDSKWMAGHIADLGVRDLTEAVVASKWPDFMQQALLYKLVDRRNRIAELYGVTERLDVRDYPAPSVTVALGTAAEVEAAERRYRLAPGSLRDALAAAGAGGPGYSETLVRLGEVTDSRRSILIHELTVQRYPSGLSDRYRRFTDRQPRALR